MECRAGRDFVWPHKSSRKARRDRTSVDTLPIPGEVMWKWNRNFCLYAPRHSLLTWNEKEKKRKHITCLKDRLPNPVAREIYRLNIVNNNGNLQTQCFECLPK